MLGFLWLGGSSVWLKGGAHHHHDLRVGCFTINLMTVVHFALILAHVEICSHACLGRDCGISVASLLLNVEIICELVTCSPQYSQCIQSKVICEMVTCSPQYSQCIQSKVFC